MCSAMSDRCRTLIMEPESISHLPFGIVWDSDLWAWLIGDLLRKPMYQLGLGHSTPIPPCELRLRELQQDQHPKTPVIHKVGGYGSGSDISRGLYALADIWKGGDARPTSFSTKLCGIRQKPEILHSDFGSKVSGGGFDPLPRWMNLSIVLRRF